MKVSHQIILFRLFYSLKFEDIHMAFNLGISYSLSGPKVYKDIFDS